MSLLHVLLIIVKIKPTLSQIFGFYLKWFYFCTKLIKLKN